MLGKILSIFGGGSGARARAQAEDARRQQTRLEVRRLQHQKVMACIEAYKQISQTHRQIAGHIEGACKVA